jgi:hypothetical protein
MLRHGRLPRVRSLLAVDLIAALCIGLLATTVAHRYLSDRVDFSYRDGSEELLHPCVGTVGWTIQAARPEASSQWHALVQRTISSLDCAALRALRRIDAGHTWDLQRYLTATLSALFWWKGPRRSGFVGCMTSA